MFFFVVVIIAYCCSCVVFCFSNININRNYLWVGTDKGRLIIVNGKSGEIVKSLSVMVPPPLFFSPSPFLLLIPPFFLFFF